MDLIEALYADGLTCVVGAGGKKTTLYALANAAERAVLTATVRIPLFDEQVSRVVVTDDPVGELDGNGEWPLGLVPEREDDRYRGYDPEVVDDLSAHAPGPVLVKADGARTREFKAPGEDEPRIPEHADTVLPVASVHVVGKPLSEEFVHRPERVADLTGLSTGDTVEPEHVAQVLAHARGGLKGVPRDATVVPVLNKVDDGDLLVTARRIAHGIHDLLAEEFHVPHVALTSHGEVVRTV
ncbi:selenium cofactor biosynthesis protein YqeC [Halomarina litorea]|uniref:selenium cofactor biosynthesis protein YqeC n=1 Tax=Halomarina litorea TaxID=2961595 RepID=UPI0020C2E378|nr:selenium cofactor biosynthesis protein YqeC [Halomarina sp. BCD28]